MARFFIDRPIFAWVIAIAITLFGALSIMTLPVSQYPEIAPPSVVISATYNGASAKTVEDSVTQVIEQNMNGLDGFMYMKSSSDSYGGAEITLTFEAGTDPDIAQVQVQNKLQTALPLLPTAVQQLGVRVEKSTGGFLMVVGFISNDPDFSRADLSDYLVASVKDPLSRIDGVGNVQVFGAQYAMRIWLDPARLVSYNLTPADVQMAIQAQNAQVSAGQLGGTPALPGQGFTASVTAQNRLETAEQFEQIILRSSQDGGTVRLRDVARIELGVETMGYGFDSRYNGQAATGIAIKMASGANAMATADRIKAALEDLSPYFPAGVTTVIPFDTTPFVKVAITKVVYTLLEAIALVFLVMYLFLQNFRSTLIPTIAVPVVLMGTFGVMAMLGFSINMLTMFGLVLAIGLLVDDAIVVVENVERLMTEEGLSPKAAAKKSMDQITGALIGIGVVLAGVMLPMAFFGGSTGVIYRQFSVTIAAAMAFSVIIAIVFTPALCATMLKPVEKGHHHAPKKGLLGGFFNWFNRVFEKGTDFYVHNVGYMLKRIGRFMVLYLLLVGVVGFLFTRMPTAFLPGEDQGILFVQASLPAGATQERTIAVLDKVRQHFAENEKDTVVSVFAVAGFSFGGTGQNMGIAFIRLKDWGERTGPGMDPGSIANRAMGAFAQIHEAQVFAFVPPAVMDLGTATGFDMFLQDRGGAGHDALVAARNQLLGMAGQDQRLTRVRPNGQEDVAEYHLNVDHAKAGALGVAVADINNTLATAWGSMYVNDFIDRGRIKKVYMQAEADARMNPEDIYKWYVRNRDGQMVPVSSFTTGHWAFGSPRLERYNGLPAVEIMGEPVQGVSSGDAMATIDEMVAKLPSGFGHEWTATSFEERRSGNQAPALYALSLLVVFLCLAALYESWSVPFSVMLVVPIGVLGALLAATMRGMPNDVYFQVGLLVTIGLSAKNAILIVEFAKHSWEKEGMTLFDATMHAARLRLRPILMTSLAFGFGVLPLAVATGAGAGSQNAIGTGVLGGTIASTAIGTIMIPLFYVVVIGIFDRKKVKAEKEAAKAAEASRIEPGAGPMQESHT